MSLLERAKSTGERNGSCEMSRKADHRRSIRCKDDMAISTRNRSSSRFASGRRAGVSSTWRKEIGCTGPMVGIMVRTGRHTDAKPLGWEPRSGNLTIAEQSGFSSVSAGVSR